MVQLPSCISAYICICNSPHIHVHHVVDSAYQDQIILNTTGSCLVSWSPLPITFIRLTTRSEQLSVSLNLLKMISVPHQLEL